MSIYEITTLLWRRKNIVAGLAVGLAVIGLVLVLVGRDTTYTGRAQVIVDQPQLLGNVSGINVPGKLANMAPTLCRLLDGDSAVADVSAASGRSADEVRRDLRCTPLEATTVIEVRVTTASARTAQATAQAGADVLATSISERYGEATVPERERISAQVLTSARVPAADDDNLLRQLAVVAFGALLLACAFAVAAEPYRRDGDGGDPASTGAVPAAAG